MIKPKPSHTIESQQYQIKTKQNVHSQRRHHIRLPQNQADHYIIER